MLQLSGEKFRLHDAYDRLIIEPSVGADLASIEAKASRIFGISAYEVAHSTKPDLRHITDLSSRLLKASGIKALRINSHRSYKQFKFDSMDIIHKVAERASSLGIEPRVKGFDGEIFISVTKEKAFVFVNKRKGAGGLPVGASGKCIVLLSGGIDSPVAAWYAMKRGLTPVYMHVHGFASNKEAQESKIPRIISILSGYWPGQRTYYIPSHVFQMAAIKAKAGRYELVLMKSFMLRLARQVAGKEGADCIVTGESLGQVASQTLSNIAAEEDAIEMPILRPLIGFDKQEIIRKAVEIGTYEQSIRPYRDVCSINARNPATSCGVKVLRGIAKEMKLDAVVRQSLKKAQVQ
jgi:thiamine biosynthesis protein ThiI